MKELRSELYNIKELHKLFNKYNVKDLQDKNGQSECYFCKNIRHCYSLTWTSFLYEYKEHYFCFHCLLLILLIEENTKLINQQKEFINWLEENYETTQDICYIKILNKYKEIIGDVK